MKYQEPKERSAEVLRKALGHMGRFDAAFNPVTFTVWYEYAAGINPRLHAAIEQLLQDQIMVGDEQVAKLHHDFIAPTDDEALQRISGEIQSLMSGMVRSASSTGERAGQFGVQLGDLSAALQARDPDRLLRQLGHTLAGAAAMKQSTDALREQVQANQNELARLREDLDRARDDAMLDPLTQILNRRGFDQAVAALIAETPDKNRQHCLVLLDIDHFKTVNDTHGHVMGDRVLQGIGEILRATVTECRAATARYGGEEFAILLPHSTLGEAVRIAELVRVRVKAMKIRVRNTQQVLFSITVSGGVAALQPGDDSAALVGRADTALYESKNAGRDRMLCA